MGIPAEQQANIQTRRWLMVWFVLTGDLTLHFSSTRITEKWLRRLCQSVHLYTVILYKHSWLELLGDQELCEIATSVPLETAVTPQNPCKHIWCKERKKRVHSLNFWKRLCKRFNFWLSDKTYLDIPLSFGTIYSFESQWHHSHQAETESSMVVSATAWTLFSSQRSLFITFSWREQ